MFINHAEDSKRVVYTPSAFAKNNLLYLQETGSLSALKPHSSNRSKLASYLFFVVLKGKGTLSYRGKSYNLEQGDCVFLDCMLPYSHLTQHDLWDLQWAHFNGDTMPGIYNMYVERGGEPVFRPQNNESYRSILSRLYKTASSEDSLRDMRINELLASLLTIIMEISLAQENQGKSNRDPEKSFSLQDVKQYLDENWAKKITLDEIADMFYINKFYLTRLFRNRYGTPMISYIMDIRIAQAKQMLRFTDKSIMYIGRTCGFEDQNYFSRSFKKIEGVTPTEYRKLWAQ